MTYITNGSKAVGRTRFDTNGSSRRFVDPGPPVEIDRKWKEAFEAADVHDRLAEVYHGGFGTSTVRNPSMEGAPFTWVPHYMSSRLRVEAPDESPKTMGDAVRFPVFPTEHEKLQRDIDMLDAEEGKGFSTSSKAKTVAKGKAPRITGKAIVEHHQREKPLPKDVVGQIKRSAKAVVNDDADIPRVPKCAAMISIMIADEAKVIKFLENTLWLLQQQVGKKMAKAWVKAICPKKQAKFPYSNKNRWEECGLGPRIPEWWPSDSCVFREPDHVKKEERVQLLLHLLRLRPSPEQLQEWSSNDKTELDHVHVTQGWTAFLKDSTQTSIFAGLLNEGKEKVQRRERLLERLFKVAWMEEEFQTGACDGEDLFSYAPEPEETETQTGRAQSKKGSLKRAAASDDELSSTAKPASRKRTRSAIQKPADSPMTDESSTQATLPSRTHTPIRQEEAPAGSTVATYITSMAAEIKPVLYNGVTFEEHSEPRRLDGHYSIPTPTESYPAAFDRYSHNMQADAGLYVDSPLTRSFGSVSSSTESMQSYYREPLPREMSSHLNFQHGQARHQHNAFQVQCARDIPQPQFDTVPNTPVLISPMANTQMVPFEQTEERQYSLGGYEPSYLVSGHQQGPKPQERVEQRGPTQHAAGQYPGYGSAPGNSFSRTSSLVPQDYQSFPTGFEPHYPSMRSIPAYYRYQYGFPEHDVPPFANSEPRVEMNFPIAPQPGDLLRGDTGHASGVGGGAWV